MKPSELQRLLALSQKTGDTLIIAGVNQQESLVIMPITRYEALLDPVLSSAEGEMKTKTAQDEQEDPPVLEDVFEEAVKPSVLQEVPVPQIEEEQEARADFVDEEERFYLEPVE